MRNFDRGSGVLVALHGHGGEPADARAWGRRLAPPGWEVVAPGAPRNPDGVRSWFESGPRGADAGDLQRSVDRLEDTVARLKGGGSRVVVAGFSQGAAVVAVALRHGLDVDAAVVLRGFLPEHAELESPAGAAVVAAGRPVLVSAGRNDDVVPDFLSEGVADVLMAEGLHVELRTDDGGHESLTEVLDGARAWISATTGRPLRVSLALPTDRVAAGAEFVSVDGIADLAAAYERLGFDACYVTDHPAPDERWLAGGGHHSLDPMVALSVAASSTRHLLLHTHVYVLGYRNPFVAAKSLASLDAVSGGRLVAGVAAGYLRPEFAAVGASFDDRAARLDQTLRLLPRIWSGEVVAEEGDGWSARSVVALPRPAGRPGPPVWVGGNSRAAMRRAVTLGDGWSPFAAPPALATATRTASIDSVGTLGQRLAELRTLCDEAGRDELPTVCFTPFSLAGLLSDPDGPLDALVDEVAQLVELGVGWITLEVPGGSRSAVLDRAARVAGALGLGRAG